VAQDNGPRLKPPGQRDTLTARALRTMAAEQRAAELEGELSSAREGLVHRDNEISSLEKSLDLNAAESVRLAGELAESAAAVEKTRSQLERMRTALSDAQVERKKAIEQREAETTQLKAELAAALERATTAENLHADAQQSLLVLNFHSTAAERRTSSLETSLRDREHEFGELQLAHGKLADEIITMSGEIAKLADEVKAREEALARAEERIGLLAKLFMQLEAKTHHDAGPELARMAGPANAAQPARIVRELAASGQRGESAVLKRDLDSDAWLFGGAKPARLS